MMRDSVWRISYYKYCINLESFSHWNPTKTTTQVRNQNSTARTHRESSNTFVVVAKPFHDGAHRLEVIHVIVILRQGRRRKRRKNGQRLVEALHSFETFQVVLVVRVRVGGNRNNGGASVNVRVLRRNTVFGGGIIVGAWDNNPAGSGERCHILLEAVVVVIIIGGGEIVEIVDARSH